MKKKKKNFIVQGGPLGTRLTLLVLCQLFYSLCFILYALLGNKTELGGGSVGL